MLKLLVRDVLDLAITGRLRVAPAASTLGEAMVASGGLRFRPSALRSIHDLTSRTLSDAAAGEIERGEAERRLFSLFDLVATGDEKLIRSHTFATV
jgi:hypothetical protein